MKKKDLLEMIEKSTLKYSSMKHIYEKYYPRIEAMLHQLPSNYDINISVLDNKRCFKNKTAFNNFIVSGNGLDHEREVENALCALYFQLQQWICTKPEQLAMFNDMQKKKSVWSNVAFLIVCIIIIVTITLTVLDWTGIFKYGNEFSLALDSLGLITGISFFWYEHHDDKVRKKINTDKEDLEIGNEYWGEKLNGVSESYNNVSVTDSEDTEIGCVKPEKSNIEKSFNDITIKGSRNTKIG